MTDVDWNRIQALRESFVDQTKADIANLLLAVDQLTESNEAWKDSQRIWHRCNGHTIRPYPTLLCSMCRGQEQDNFHAVDALLEAEAQRDRVVYALQLLVAAKDMKDQDGPSDDYRWLKERAWLAARACLADL